MSFQEFDNVNKDYLNWYKQIYFRLSQEGKIHNASHSAYYTTEVPKIPDIIMIIDKVEDKQFGS